MKNKLTIGIILIIACSALVFNYLKAIEISPEELKGLMGGNLGLAVYQPSQGGTGTSTNPSYGQLLLGQSDGSYDLVATSTLGIVSGGGSQTPWTSNIDGGGYDLSNVANITATATTTTANAHITNNLVVDGNIYGSFSFVTTGDLQVDNIKLSGNTIEATNDSGLNLYDNASNGLTVLDGGNIGIGTTGPNYKLEVNGTASTTSLYLGNGIATPAGTFLALDPTGLVIATSTPSGGDVSKVGTPVDNQIGVWTGDGTIEGENDLTFNSLTNKMYLNGLLGIGNSDPSFMLEVKSASTARIQIENTDNNAYTALQIKGDGKTYNVGGGGSNVANADLRNAFYIYDGTNYRMVIDSDGNFGIATTSPAYKLDVYGNTRTDGTLTVSGATTIGGTLALGTNDITMTGSLAETGSRITKGWFTDVESTNMYTVGGTSLSSTFSPIAGSASITTLGTIGTGTWQATDVGVPYGGTGVSTLTDHGVLVGSGASAITALTVGTNGQLLIGSTGADPVFATLNCANSLTCTTGAGTLQIDVDDDFLLNTGDTGTGVYDFGGATSFELPQDSVVNASGEVSIDTATSSIRYFDGTAERALYDIQYKTFTIASSTLDAYEGQTASSTIPLGVASIHGETWTEISCFSDAGTVGAEFGDNTNWMDYQPISTTLVTDNSLINNTFTRYEKRYIRVGQASSLGSFSCTVGIREDAD